MPQRIEQIQVRRGYASQWTTINYPLRSGEFGYEVDTGKLKIGNGFSPWNDLPYFVDVNGVAAMIAAAIANITSGGSDPRIGNLTDLTTTDKTTVVGAINEVNTPTVPLTVLYENAKAG